RIQVDRDRQIQGCSTFDAGRSPHLELVSQLQGAVTGGRRNLHGLAVGRKQRELEPVAHVRLIPWHSDLHCDGHDDRTRVGDRPSSTENVELAIDRRPGSGRQDRKSTRLNSSHVAISYAVFCLKKKKRSTRST